MSSSMIDIRKQLHGDARHLSDSFNRHFSDFDESGMDYMVVTEWRQGVSATRQLDSKCYASLSEADHAFLTIMENKEVKEVYLFHWDLGIDLVMSGTSHRAEKLTEQFNKALNKDQ